MTEEVEGVYRLACLELRGGNGFASYAAELPGLLAWISCNPLQPAARGGVHSPSIKSAWAGLPGRKRTQWLPLGAPSTRTPLLYFASASGLVAIPVMALNPRDALQVYLSGPPAPELTGLPADVRLLAHEYNSADRLLSLKFSYTPSLRALAMDRPERMRTVLLGLIATLTEFPEIRTVQLDFGGQTRLGLGQCSDLLRTPQRRPTLLNDERLL